jgi:pantoate--beta-alanine ligase
MGSLHSGHISLIENLLKSCDRVITTIFVNPTQFGEGEDLDAYPRTEAEDVAKIMAAGGHLVFVPHVAEVYPEGFATRVEVDGLTDVLCGASRPGHFDGVTQVVAKLLNQAGPDVAIFGEKDWQQLTVIRRMVRDLDIPVEIQGATIVRDEFGLALSSRNAYLSADEIVIARQFNTILRRCVYDIASSDRSDDSIEDAKMRLNEAGITNIDYLECRDAETLEPIVRLSDRSARLFSAVYIGPARLIDNFPIN